MVEHISDTVSQSSRGSSLFEDISKRVAGQTQQPLSSSAGAQAFQPQQQVNNSLYSFLALNNMLNILPIFSGIKSMPELQSLSDRQITRLCQSHNVDSN